MSSTTTSPPTTKEKETFDNIGISTETIIGKTNCKINIVDLFQILPVTEYTVVPKKRGRRPKDEKKVEIQTLNDGDIITLKIGDRVRGVDLKMKKSKSENYFRNSITIVMSCDGKLINFKISKNGKFQFTGCKNDSHSQRCLEYVMGYIDAYNSSPVTNHKKILTLPPQSNLEVIYSSSSLGFNYYSRDNTGSIYVPNSNTSFNLGMDTNESLNFTGYIGLVSIYDGLLSNRVCEDLFKSYMETTPEPSIGVKYGRYYNYY
jgi:hypothetical protein